MTRLVLLVTVLMACGDDSSHPADAKTTDSLIDSGSCSHVLFLNYEGGTVIGGGPDDAPTNTASVASPGTYLLPAFLENGSTRATTIQAITDQVTTTLAPYATVVTARPSSGGYHMIMLTGSPTNLGLPSPQLPAIGAIGSCQTGVPKAVSFVFDAAGGSFEPARVGNYVIGLYGASKAVPWPTRPGDCMCSAGGCSVNNGECTIGGAGTPRDSTSPCGSGATFDEQAAFAAMPCD